MVRGPVGQVAERGRGLRGRQHLGGGICDSTGQDTDMSWEDTSAVRYLEVDGDRRVLTESWRRRGHRSDQTRRGMQLVVRDLRGVGQDRYSDYEPALIIEIKTRISRSRMRWRRMS